MTTLKLMLGTAACVVPLALFAAPAGAVTAHNYQHGTNTTNNNSDRQVGMTQGQSMMPMKHRKMRHHMRRM